MGVTGLWPILAPTARPTPLPTLNRKRLAVDASIWIYQFLKAVRDKEGNALRNSHVVGFFRRICKLLFFGIKPVFVFDGGAPILKRQTVLGRKKRREGRREDAARTAGRLLAVQMKKRGEEDEERRRRERDRVREGGRPAVQVDEEVLPDESEMVFVGELGMSAAERNKSRKFYKKDAYHLPDLASGIEGMGQPNDPRIMSAEQLEEYARQFNNGEDVNLYDFSKIDFNGDFFMSLPAGDRYNILNAARLRSRLRMGLSKEQLEEMFPDRMAFSKFQIERVRERNELTQRLMNLNGMNEGEGEVGLIAGESGREYVLVKNDGAEGGWALGVVNTEKGSGGREKPIDVDALNQKIKENEIDEEEDEDEFEDVPFEGLNQLPKLKPDTQNMTYEDFQRQEMARRGMKQQHAKNGGNSRQLREPSIEQESLFVDDDFMTGNDLFFNEEDEDINHAIALSLQKDQDPGSEIDDEEHLSRAIALSLQKNHHQEPDSAEDEEFEDVPMAPFEQRAVPDAKPLISTSGRMVAHIVNNRANASLPKRRAASVSSDSDMDLQSALKKARKQKAPEKKGPVPVITNQKNPFDGPLPFERINFKSSLFGKSAKESKDGEKRNDEDVEGDGLAGGFEKNATEEARPLPPWLAGNTDVKAQVQEQQKLDREFNAADREQALEAERHWKKYHAPIEVNSSDDDSDVEILDAPPPPTLKTAVEAMGDIAENVRAEPPVSGIPNDRLPSVELVRSPKDGTPAVGDAEDEEIADWSESDYGDLTTKSAKLVDVDRPAGGRIDTAPSRSRSTSIEFEDVEPSMQSGDRELSGDMIETAQSKSRSTSIEFEDVIPPTQNGEKQASPAKSPSPVFEDVITNVEASAESLPALPISLPAGESTLPENEFIGDADFDDFSDPDDEELLAQLAIEAEEHARFASTLNNKSEKENQDSYDRDIKALRSQQQKDRRDADEVTHIMIEECQALLRLFGLPYVTAPMEAEAQCAELVRLGLVDGIVTDDSDIFLFGGTRVYKNMFNSNKFVECYLSADLEKELSLSRDQLISIAHLLGSDYTEGLAGVGPVTALEILSEFPTSTGLDEFRSWWSTVQLSNAPLSTEISTFRKKFRRSQATKLFLPPGFPSPAVTEAYLKPDVDSTPEPFQWGVPDLDRLRDFLMATIGWSSERTDEVLVPVIQDMNRRETEGTQSNITRFFDGAVGVGAKEGGGRNVGSKRMRDAVGKLKSKKGKESGLGGTFADKAMEWAGKNDLSWTEREQAKMKKKGGKRKKRAVDEDAEFEKDVGVAAALAPEGDADDESGSSDEFVAETASRNKGKGKGKLPARRKRAKV